MEWGPTQHEYARRHRKVGINIRMEVCDAQRTPTDREFTLMWPNKERGAYGGCDDDHVFYWAFTCEE